MLSARRTGPRVINLPNEKNKPPKNVGDLILGIPVRITGRICSGHAGINFASYESCHYCYSSLMNQAGTLFPVQNALTFSFLKEPSVLI